jgi:hypothetical protein
MTFQTVKGERMRKMYSRILIALIGVTGLGMAAKGQAVEQVVVNIPYEFVVAGKTMPAGTYRVNRVFGSNERALVLNSFENRASATVLPTEVASAYANKARVSFEQVGDQRFLSKIETGNTVFTIPVSRSAIMEASAKSHGGASASGRSTGSN